MEGEIILAACSESAVCNFWQLWIILSPFGYLVLMADVWLSRQRSHLYFKIVKGARYPRVKCFCLKSNCLNNYNKIRLNVVTNQLRSVTKLCQAVAKLLVVD